MTTDPAAASAPSRTVRRFRWLIIAVIAVVVVYCALWFTGAWFVKSTLEDTLADLSDDQTEITCGDISVWGLPFRYDVTCTNAFFRDGDETVSLPEIKATALIYRPTHILLFATSPATYADAFTGIEREIGWESLRASARSSGWALARVSLEAEAITFADTLISTTELARVGHLEAHLLDVPERHNAETGLTEIGLYLAMDGADLSEADIADGRLTLEAEIPGVPDDMRLWNLPRLALSWQNDPIRILNLQADDTASSVEIVGQFGVDADAYLEGDFDLTTSNVYERLLEVAQPPTLDLFLGQQNEDGSYYRAYSLRHGVLMAGNVSLMPTQPLF